MRVGRPKEDPDGILHSRTQHIPRAKIFRYDRAGRSIILTEPVSLESESLHLI